MENDKDENRPRGGAQCFDEIDAASTTSKSLRRNTVSALLCFTCGACFVLSLICICLVTLVILLDQTVEATSHRYDSNRSEAYRKMTDNDESFRLPKEVKPVYYEIYLHPILLEGTFSGTVTIMLNVLDKRRSIALHQKDLNVTSAKLMSYGLEEDYEIKISSVSNPTKYDIFVISTETEFNSGLYKLFLEFNGSLEKKIVGFYSSKYELPHEDTSQEVYKESQLKRRETRYLATSKFEPTYARQAFPCFDEPSFKAEFSIKLVHPTNDCYSALSNMIVEHREVDKPERGLTTVSFASSLPMSTYLACFIVSDFDSTNKMAISPLDKKEFLVSVYSTRAQSKKKRYFALDIGVRALEYYINLFKINYPLPKLDLVAIPDFVSGAMENWGIVTFREVKLLYDERNNSINDKREIVNVICHELAHMWFGNLVTLSWWNDLWLNEGFATFMSYKSSNEILSNQGYMEQFLIDIMHSVFITDAKLSSHPIVHDVKNADEISSFFDEISYKKGASVIRMMENFIGPDYFYGAITKYLTTYTFRNAETADLFNIVQSVAESKLNVTAIMDTWTRQEGYPVINAKRSGNTFVLTQKRFLADPDADFNPSKSDYGYRWTVPITYITNKNKIPTLVWFDKDASEVIIEIDERTEWVKFNAGQVGYYRVNYGEEWKSFMEVFKHHHMTLSIPDRANLLDDLFSLADAGEVDYTVVLDFLLYLMHEYHALPWAVVCSKMKTIYFLLNSAKPDLAWRLQKYSNKLISSIYKDDITWIVDDNIEDDVPFPHIDNKMRATILEFACIMNVPGSTKKAEEILNDWIYRDIPPHPDIRELVYRYGVRNVKEIEWNYVFQRYRDEVDPIEKHKLLVGVTGTRSTEWLKDLINRATDESNVRTQDFLKCLILISENPDGTSIVWDWVRDNWEFLVDRYTLNDRYLGQLIPAITKFFATDTKLDEMRAFFKRYPEAGAGADNRAKALETVSNNIKWINRNSEILDAWYSMAQTKGEFN